MSERGDDLVRLAADLLGAEQSEVFISIDGRTVPGSRVRREVRALLEGRLTAAEVQGAATLDLPLSDVTERILAWDSIVLSEAAAARLVHQLADEGWVEVVQADRRDLRVRRGPGPAAEPPA
jgi:hypothetical protein